MPLGLLWLQQIQSGRVTLDQLAKAWADDVDVHTVLALVRARFPEPNKSDTK